MDYLRFKKKALLSQAYNVLFCEMEDNFSSTIDITTVRAEGKNFICMFGGTSSLQIAIDILTIKAMQVNVYGNFQLHAVMDMLAQSNIVVNIIAEIDVSALINVSPSKHFIVGMDNGALFNATGQVLQSTNMESTVDSSFDMSIFASLSEGDPLPMMASLVYQIAMTVNTYLATGQSFEGMAGSIGIVAAMITSSAAMNIVQTVTGSLTVESVTYVSLSKHFNVTMTNQLVTLPSVDIVTIATVGDYAEWTLESMDSKTLYELAYYGL